MAISHGTTITPAPVMRQSTRQKSEGEGVQVLRGHGVGLSFMGNRFLLGLSLLQVLLPHLRLLLSPLSLQLLSFGQPGAPGAR